MKGQVIFLIPNPSLLLVTTLLVSHLHVFHAQYGQRLEVAFNSCQGCTGLNSQECRVYVCNCVPIGIIFQRNCHAHRIPASPVKLQMQTIGSRRIGDATRSSKSEGYKLGFQEPVHVGIRVYRQPQCEGMKICTMEREESMCMTSLKFLNVNLHFL
jgi:hypothetical protein